MRHNTLFTAALLSFICVSACSGRNPQQTAQAASDCKAAIFRKATPLTQEECTSELYLVRVDNSTAVPCMTVQDSRSAFCVPETNNGIRYQRGAGMRWTHVPPQDVEATVKY